MTSRKIGFSLLLALLAAVGILAAWMPFQKTVPVLMYHHITDHEPKSKLEVSQKVFAMQMEFLKKKGFQVISPEDLKIHIQSGRRPEKQVVLTFDDGYLDNYVNAIPILEKLGFKATFFVVTDWVGKPGFMDWDQMRVLEKLGHAIGSHCLSHRFLTEIDLAEAKGEIYNSKALIEERLGHPVRFFCYPAGRFNTALHRMVQEAGYQGAFTTAPGCAFDNRDVFALKRIRISESSDRPWKFWWRVWGYYLLFRERTARRMQPWS